MVASLLSPSPISAMRFCPFAQPYQKPQKNTKSEACQEIIRETLSLGASLGRKRIWMGNIEASIPGEIRNGKGDFK